MNQSVMFLVLDPESNDSEVEDILTKITNMDDLFAMAKGSSDGLQGKNAIMHTNPIKALEDALSRLQSQVSE
jgi:hypothetical protein